jgi:transposase
MTQYVGLDVSMRETKLHVLDEAGQRVWRGRCATEPAAIAETVRRYAPTAVRIGLETGPLTTWLWTVLTADGLPMVCLDARHAKKALDMKVNKTDANDAEGLAHLVRAGWYREVRVKGRGAMLAKALLGARSQLLGMSLSLENQIRGILKTFGRIVPKGAGGLFEKDVRALITDDGEIAAVIMPLLQARQMARAKCAALDRRLMRSVQDDATCRMLMTMPGVGPTRRWPMSRHWNGPIALDSRAPLLPGSDSRRGASSRAKLTMTATSRDAVMVNCARSFTKPRVCC